MSRPKKTDDTTSYAFTLKRVSGAWAVIRYEISGDKVLKSEQVTPEDMLPITTAKMIALVMESNR